MTDPFSVAMYSTEKEDFNFLEVQDKKGVPLRDALRSLARDKYGLKTEYPYAN